MTFLAPMRRMETPCGRCRIFKTNNKIKMGTTSNGASLRIICMRNHMKILTKTGCPKVTTPIVPITDLAEV